MARKSKAAAGAEIESDAAVAKRTRIRSGTAHAPPPAIASPAASEPIEGAEANAEMGANPAASRPEASAAAGAGFGAAFSALWPTAGALAVSPEKVTELQQQYLLRATELWNGTLQAWVPSPAGAAAAPPPKSLDDRRFAAPDWVECPAATYTAQMYLLNARTLLQLADSLQGDDKTRARVRFAVQQWVDAMSPSNYLALNPEAQRKALATGGESIALGLQHLLHDLKQGHLSQTDEAVFEVGRNVATTAGDVVFENEYLQLIEYKSLTDKVHARPMLFVPPCINKYYILDLQPANSLIRHTVAQGHRVFVISWRNPDDTMAGRTWDDYIENAVIQAIRVVQDISGAQTINTLGFCIGGTLLACALSVLAARGEKVAESATLLTTFLDFSNTGVLDVFIDETLVHMRERTLGDQAPGGPRLLKGTELATTFNFLRPNDLVWNYVVGNYLKGETPPAFDLLYWNGDTTNMPGPMYCWYLRHAYLENSLRRPGALTVCGVPLDLSLIDAPVYVYGSRDDHIVPWKGAYASNELLRGDTRFVLGASGHIAGVINPPQSKKRSYWTNDRLPASADAWLDGATEHPGSWWPDWDRWLANFAGDLAPAPSVPGNRAYPPIEPAPGRYVAQKA